MLSGRNQSALAQAVASRHRMGISTFAPLALLCSVLLLQACSPATEPTASDSAPEQQVALPLGDTSQNALDWDGTYQGVLPCASCEGIETRLELRDDGSYHLVTVYLGEEPDNQFEQQGKFAWDEQGRVIKLDAPEGEAVYFKVEENAVRQLDQDAEQISGPLADHYRLNKLPDNLGAVAGSSATEVAGFTGIDWQLTELLSDTLANDTRVFVHFAADGKVYGNSGCNQFSGSWGLDNQRLRLGQMVSTMRACPEPQMQLEQVFLAQLALADNYTLADNTLSLNKARMAPLARFKVKQ